MNEWFDVPDNVGVWFGVRVMIQVLVWFVVIVSIIKQWDVKKYGLLLEMIGSAIVVVVLVLSGAADELLSVFAFLFGINPSGW